MLYYVIYVVRGESNRRNESHDDPMNERLAAWGEYHTMLYRTLCKYIYIYTHTSILYLDIIL